jgi:hypothetical protein
MYCRAGTRTRLVAAAMLMALIGCTRTNQPPPVPEPAVVVAPSGLTVGAVPAYRLATSPSLVDYPSRLFVINVRVGTTLGGALTVAPDGIVLTLPNGQQGRVFDRPRAVEVLHRGTLADVNLAYLNQDGGYHPGNLGDEARLQLTDTVLSHLLSDSAFIAGQEVEGFVVVDTLSSFASLNGGSLQVTAYRMRDATPVTAVYQFVVAAAAPPAEATPTVAPAELTATPTISPLPVETATATAAAAVAPEAATATMTAPETATATVTPPEAASATAAPQEPATATVAPQEAATAPVAPQEAATAPVAAPMSETPTAEAH